MSTSPDFSGDFPGGGTTSSALLTDQYELTMLEGALKSGTAHRKSVFELFPRRLPEGRRYGVVAGVGRALDAIEAFRFTDVEIDFLRKHDIVDEPTLDYLADYRFSGDIWGYPEGETYFPYSPLVNVEATFAEAVLLETVLLSIYNHDSAIASAASRMAWAAGDRPCIEMGSRRTHEQAAVASARAAYVAGFTATSNLRARPGVRRTVPRHQRALLHAPARHRGGRVPRPGGVARQGNDPARRHLRHRGGRAARRWRSRGRSWAQSGSTPATSACSRTGCAHS